MIGYIKWYDEEKGYGFIEYDDCQDIFFHGSVLENDYKLPIFPGQIIKYELIITCKGLQANKVTILNNN